MCLHLTLQSAQVGLARRLDEAALLDRLGIILPKRLRLAQHELPAFARSA